MTTCKHCGTEWTGLTIAHCSVCHHTFSTPANFDRHRAGSKNGAYTAGECSDPLMRGLVRNRHGWFGMPGTDDITRSTS